MAITKAMRFGNIVFHIDISVSQVHKVEEIPINKIKIADVHNFEKVFLPFYSEFEKNQQL